MILKQLKQLSNTKGKIKSKLYSNRSKTNPHYLYASISLVCVVYVWISWDKLYLNLILFTFLCVCVCIINKILLAGSGHKLPFYVQLCKFVFHWYMYEMHYIFVNNYIHILFTNLGIPCIYLWNYYMYTLHIYKTI